MFRRTFAKLPLIFLLLFLVQNIPVSYAIDLPDAISVEHSFPKKEYRRGELGNVSIAVTNNMPVSVKLLNLSLSFDWQHGIAIYPEACYFLEFRPDPRILASGEIIVFKIEFYVSSHIPQGQHKYEISSYYKAPYSPIRGFYEEDTITIKGNVSVSESTVNQLLTKATIMLNSTKLSAFNSTMAKKLTDEANKAYHSGQDSYEKGEFDEAAYYFDLTIVFAMCAYKAETDYWIQEARNKISEAEKLIHEAEAGIPSIADVAAALERVTELLDFAKKLFDIAEQEFNEELKPKKACKLAILVACLAEQAIAIVVASAGPPPLNVTLTPSAAPSGATVTAVGTGFAKEENVDIYWPGLEEELATATTDEDGEFTTTFTVPVDTPGVYEMNFSAPSGSVTVDFKLLGALRIVSLSIPSTVYPESKFTISVNVQDYVGTPITGATVTGTVTPPVGAKITLTFTETTAAIYTASWLVPADAAEGSYTVDVKAEKPEAGTAATASGSFYVEVDISALEKAVSDLTGDVSSLSSDVSKLGTDVSGLKSDIAALEAAIAAIPIVPVEWIYITAIMAIIAAIAAIAAVVAIYREKTKT